MIVDSLELVSRTALSVDLVRRELFRGIVGVRLGTVFLEAREPILLGSSMPPPISMGPREGAIADTRLT